MSVFVGNFATNLIAAYRASLDAGAQATDQSGNGRHGTLSGGVTRVSDGGVAYNFQDSSDQIDLGAIAALQFQPSSPFTVSFWARTAAFNGHHHFLAYGGDSVGQSAWYVAREPAMSGQSSAIYFDFYDGVNVYRRRTTPVANATWVHVVVSRDDTSAITGHRLWLNGVEQGLVGISGTPGAMNYSGFSAKLGRRHNGNNGFAGRLDDVLFWSRQLTTQEISALHTGGRGAAYASLLVSEAFVEVLGSTADAIDLRVSETFVEVLGTTADPIDLRLAEVFVEVLGSTAPLPYEEDAAMPVGSSFEMELELDQVPTSEPIDSDARLPASATVGMGLEQLQPMVEMIQLPVTASLSIATEYAQPIELAIDLPVAGSFNASVEVVTPIDHEAGLGVTAGLQVDTESIQPIELHLSLGAAVGFNVNANVEHSLECVMGTGVGFVVDPAFEVLIGMDASAGFLVSVQVAQPASGTNLRVLAMFAGCRVFGSGTKLAPEALASFTRIGG